MLDCLKKIDKVKTGVFAECILKTAATVQENAEDIYAEAKQINEDRAAQAEEFEDEAVEDESFEKVTEE